MPIADFKASPCFNTTQWTTILSARSDDPEASLAALERLCRAYWYPLYIFVRRKGKKQEDAQDLVQGFFEKLLAKGYLHSADPHRGRFRSFLLASLTHYMANEWDRANRQKRGGGASIVSIDAEDAEARLRIEPVDHLSPDRAYERAWATTVVERVMARLEADYTRAGEPDRFQRLRVFLTGAENAVPYLELAETLRLGEGGVKTAVRRMRLRFAELLRAELSETLVEPANVDDEIRNLLGALAG